MVTFDTLVTKSEMDQTFLKIINDSSKYKMRVNICNSSKHILESCPIEEWRCGDGSCIYKVGHTFSEKEIYCVCEKERERERVEQNVLRVK